MSNEVIYIPEYVEQGIAKLQQAKGILAQIAAAINSGISTVNASGYNRGIPHIEKGDKETSDLTSLEATINTITTEIEKYSNGEALELEHAIIIADPATISKYGLKKEDIDFTLSEYILKSDKVTSNPTIQGKWESGYLRGPAGFIKYTGADGRLTKETWCNLNPNNLAKLMREDHGIELDYWIREDGVYMYGDYVMVAADIPHMDGTQQEAEYRKGDLVQTSLGTGMVVDLCGMAESTRKGNTDVEVWYDIYTAWGTIGKYKHPEYCTKAGCTDASHTNKEITMIRKAENPTTINPRTGQPISSGFVFKGNNATPNTTTQAREETTTTTTTPSTQDTTKSEQTFNTNPTQTTPQTVQQQTLQTLQTQTPDTNAGTYTPNNSQGSFTSTPSTGTYTGNTPSGSYTGGTSPSYVSTPSSGIYKPSGQVSTPNKSTSQVTNLTDVNGFSKPVVNTTPQPQTPTYNNTVVTQPTTPTPVPPVVTEPAPAPQVPTDTVISEEVLTPEVDVNDMSDVIISRPIETPEINDVEIDTEIFDNDTQIESVPVPTPSDTPINSNKSNNTMPIVAALAATGVVGAGIGAKVYFDKRKENQNNGEDEDNSYEE